MKRAYVLFRILYRKWKRSISKKPTLTEYILLVAVFTAIIIKFKGPIEERLFKDNSYYRYYDRVEPNIRNHPYIED